ncbi:hypothetical protein [Brevibacterium yomogidense]|uniref:hypothetical protein n=1 Tax=Brevibacterium yomogidense TaxID=946573 RepID=UPI0018DF3DB3|nr:hypothetical protein [Brevibacterium yomogidense]
MKKQTLAPAVLATFTAAGLVLAPVAAFAQDTAEQDTALTDAATSTPTPKSAEKTTEPSADPSPSDSDGDDDDSPEGDGGSSQEGGDAAQDDSGDSAPGDGSEAEQAEPTEEPTDGENEGEEEPTEDPQSEDEDEAPESDPELAVDPDDAKLTDVVYFSGEEESTGVHISATGLDDEQTYSLTIDGGEEPAVTEPLTPTDGEASSTYRIAVDAATDLAPYAGSRTVTLTDEDGQDVANGSFTITDDTEDEAPVTDPALEVPESIAVDDLMVPQGEEPGDRGLPITAIGLVPGDSYTFRVVAPEENSDLTKEFPTTASEEGTATGSYFIEWWGDYNADAIAGMYTVELVGADEEILDSAEVEFVGGSDDGSGDEGDSGDDGEDSDGGEGNGDDGQAGEDDGDDEAALDPSVAVSPQKLPAADFMNYDKGVQVTASDCLPGDTVSLEVYWPGTDDVAYADGIEADDDGNASFSFYGTGSNASDYVGTWKVGITCGGETASDSFTVTGSKNDDGRSGSDLPRTGSDAGILAIVATSLLTVGAATVMVSSRPKRRDTV